MADWDSQLSTDIAGREVIRPTMPEREIEMLPQWDNDGQSLGADPHGNSGQAIARSRLNKHALEALTPEEYQHWFELFDAHLETFFTSRIRPTRRVSVAIPVFAGIAAGTPLVSGPGLITGYSLQGAATKVATFFDSKAGTGIPILSVGFDTKTVNTSTPATPGILFTGTLTATLNDPSIFGVLYIEKVVVDDASY